MNYNQLLKLLPDEIHLMEDLIDTPLYHLNYKFVLNPNSLHRKKSINILKSNNIKFDEVEFLYIDRSDKIVFIEYTEHHPLYSK